MQIIREIEIAEIIGGKLPSEINEIVTFLKNVQKLTLKEYPEDIFYIDNYNNLLIYFEKEANLAWTDFLLIEKLISKEMEYGDIEYLIRKFVINELPNAILYFLGLPRLQKIENKGYLKIQNKDY
jgi:hypothetical protein